MLNQPLRILPETPIHKDIPVYLTPDLMKDATSFVESVFYAHREVFKKSGGRYRPSLLWLPMEVYDWADHTFSPDKMSSAASFLIRLHPSLRQVSAHEDLENVAILIDENYVKPQEDLTWLTKPLAHPQAVVLMAMVKPTEAFSEAVKN